MVRSTGYQGKVGLIYALTLCDLVINGVADHNQVPDPQNIAPFAWVG